MVAKLITQTAVKDSRPLTARDLEAGTIFRTADYCGPGYYVVTYTIGELNNSSVVKSRKYRGDVLCYNTGTCSTGYINGDREVVVFNSAVLVVE